MNQLRDQIRRAWRRWAWGQLLANSAWCVSIGLAVAVVAVALPRLVAISSLPGHWDLAWLVAALVGGLVAAGVWTFFARRGQLHVALEIDRRFALRERLSSGLSLSGDDQASEAGQALMRDATRAANGIDVAEAFPLRLNRRASWPLLPAAMAFVLVTFVDHQQATSSLDTGTSAARAQVKMAVDSLRKKIAKRGQQAKEQDLEAAAGLFNKIEQASRELGDREDVDRASAAVKLNELARQLDDRKEQLGTGDALRKQLKNMEASEAGPAKQATRAMQQGNWEEARKQLESLHQQLGDGTLDAKAKQQLAQQLHQMRQNVQAAVDAHRQATDDLKQQIELQKQRGDLAKAGQLQQKLDGLQQQQQQTDRSEELSQQMGEIASGLERGNIEQATNAMAKAVQQLERLQQDSTELALLEATTSDLQRSKAAIACPQCNGQGCQACQGESGTAARGDNASDQTGKGIGQGEGSGQSTDQERSVNLHDAQVRQEPSRGPAVLGGTVEGANERGNVAESIKQEMSTLNSEPADPLTSERLPRQRRQHAAEYFRTLRDGP